MEGFLHLQALGADESGRFFGRVGSIIHKRRPAIALELDKVPANIAAPVDLVTDFPSLKDKIAKAAISVGRIETAGLSPQVLATCFRVGSNPKRVATARHVAVALLHESAILWPGDNPKVEARNSNNRKLRDLFVVFEANDEKPVERFKIAKIELSHGSMDLMLLQLEEPSSRPPLLLPDPHSDQCETNDPVCVLGYPVSRPSASEDEHFDELFKVNEKISTGIKRASPGLLGTPSNRPGPTHLHMLHDATTLPGSSGSPVISNVTGHLIGIHVRGNDGQDSNTMINMFSALAESPEQANPLRTRFDPDFAAEQSATFQTWTGDSTNKVFGRPQHRSMTAEELASAAMPAKGQAISAAPGTHAHSPALLSDRRDIRDRYYNPPLSKPKSRILPKAPARKSIRRQSLLADCTGCAMAVTIERALTKQKRHVEVSERMLYEMSRLHDEFVDEAPQGSSLRGAIKGFFHNGVCLASTDDGKSDWFLSVARAKQARKYTLGSYFRLRPNLPDFQMAVQKTGAVVVSAKTHPGWSSPKNGVIVPKRKPLGAHAFVLIGYDETGFIIQNSWGPDWGGYLAKDATRMPGVAHWAYTDWADSVIDAWVLQVAPSAPKAHNLPLRTYLTPTEPQLSSLPPEIQALPEPRRQAIIGHMAHVERSGLVDIGRIGFSSRSIRETSIFLASAKSWERKKNAYTDLVFIFHDPTLGAECAARVSAHLAPRLKAAQAYPMNIVYGADEIRSLTARMIDESRFAGELTSGGPDDLTHFLERRAKNIGESLLDSYLTGLDTTSKTGGPLWAIPAAFAIEGVQPPKGVKQGPRNVHVVAFGIGALAAHACFGKHTQDSRYQTGASSPFTLASVSLLAPVARPACNMAESTSWNMENNKTASGKTKTAKTVQRLLVKPMGPERPLNAALDRYRGDWTDLLTAMLSTDSVAHRATGWQSRNPGTLPALMTDKKLLNDVMKNIDRNNRLGEWAAF